MRRCSIALVSTLWACAATPGGPDATTPSADATTPSADATVANDAPAGEDRADAGGADAQADDDSGAPDAGSAPSWASCPRLPGGPRQETAVVTLAGELYVLGGFDAASRVVDLVEIFDPRAGTWRSGPSLPVPMHHAHAAVVGQRLFVLGFLTGLDFRADGRGFVLEPGAATWTAVADLPAGTERGGGATAVVGADVYVIGGLRGGAVRDVTVYDSAANVYRAGPALPEARDHLGAVGLGDRVVVVGGRRGRIEAHAATTWILDGGAATWRAVRPMPTSRGGFALAASGERIFVFGGEGNPDAPSGVFADVEAYAVSSDTWEVADPMPRPRHGTGAATIDGVVYIPGGADRLAFGAVPTCSTYRP